MNTPNCERRARVMIIKPFLEFFFQCLDGTDAFYCFVDQPSKNLPAVYPSQPQDNAIVLYAKPVFVEVFMARYSDIKGAFVSSVTQDPNKGQVVTTERFLAELAKVNQFWSLQEANEWIAHYQGFFRDYSDQEGESKRYFLKNMGYVIRKVRREHGISITSK